MIPRRRLLATLVLAGTCLASAVAGAPALAAAPAWSPIAATGPTVIPAQQSEVQKLFVDAAGGTFRLTARHLAATGIANLTASTVIGVTTSSGAFAVGQAIEGFGIQPGTTITAIGSGTLTLSQQPTGVSQGGAGVGTSVAAYDTPQTTTALPYNAPVAEVRGSLEALSVVGAGNVEVSGGPGGPGAQDPYIVTFKGTLANLNIAQLTPDNSLLTGGQGADTVTTVPGGQGTSKLALMVQNIGGAASSGTVTYKATLPSGITTVAPPRAPEETGPQWTCGASTATEIVCTWSASVEPSLTPATIDAVIAAAPGAESGVVHVEVLGGGAATATAELPLTVSSIPAKPGIQSFTAGAYDPNGNVDVRAGGHPYSASTGIFVNTVRTARGTVVPAGEFRDITVELPPGFLGNPVAVPACSETVKEARNCPLDTMVAVVQPVFSGFGYSGATTPVFNTQAPYGYPAKFRFEIASLVPLSVVGTLRSDEDYGLDAASLNTPQLRPVYGTFFTFWGEPAAHSHDSSRCKFIENHTGCEASDAANVAFLTNATNCSEQASIAAEHGGLLPTNLNVTLWQNPGEIFRSSAGIPPVTGCDNLHFESAFTFQPGEAPNADSPAAFTTNLTVPSEGLTNPEKLTTPEAKTTVVHFPKGLTLNPSAAGGLGACSEAQIGLTTTSGAMPNPIRFDKDPNTCPESSKIGSVEIKTPLLAETLHGALYLARQGENPFGSLFAVYLVIEDPKTGIFIKLPGNTVPDPQTGQITATFEDLPQLPFESLKLGFKGGSRAPFATPETCGKYVTTTLNTPWSAPESGPPFETNENGQGFTVGSAPGNGACAATPSARPFGVTVKAGTEGTQAGAHSPFDLQVTRPDGAQEIQSLDIVTPTGLSATLAGVPYCTEAEIRAAEALSGTQEQTSPACPAASQVGTTQVGAGSGPNPFYTPGKLYLAGPYRGAPLSMVAITPAVAGPFDLGDVVVRTALYVNPETAQITAKSDPLPEFLKGVQLRIRDIRIDLDRSDFTLNPTSCEPKSVGVTVHGNSGATANLSQRYQVGNCAALPFEPNLKLQVLGGTKRNAKPKLRAELTYKPGEANIATAQVNLPHSEFLEQNHIKTVCTRVQFAEGDGNGSACPAGSIYGHATAWSPLLEKPLEGPVFLRSNGGERKLPDLVAALDGQVDIALWGKVDSGPNHGIRSTFEVVPDAPVSRFVLEMNGGKKGLLVNSENLCSKKAKRQAIVRFTGQNGKVHAFKPLVQNQCKKGKKAKARKKGQRGKGTKRAQSRTVALMLGVRGGW